MNTFTKLGCAALLAVSMSFAAEALTITPATGTLNVTRWQGNETGQPQIDAVIAPIIGSATELYKQNVGGSESGAAAGSYTTTFSNSPSDPSDALIDYVGSAGSTIITGTVYLLVKDGNQTPAWYLFKLTGWDGKEDINLSGFWPNQGAISHVTLYGTSGTDGGTPPPGVPDAGSTLVLLGAALGGFGVLRRKIGA